MLEPLGIVKGNRFSLTRNLQIIPRYTEPYWTGTPWYKSFDRSISQETETKVELDEQATWFYEAATRGRST